MKIGTLRPEEAKVFDGSAGEHRINGVTVGVYWADEGNEEGLKPGWAWFSPNEGVAGATGFSTSFRALSDAEETLG